MFQNSWSFKLSEPPKYVTTILLPQPALVFQGSSNQLLVFHKNQTITLPIRKQVIGLCNLPRREGEEEDCQQILLLTPDSLLCFNFLSNEQKYSIELENAQKIVLINDKVYVICGDSLHCFNLDCEELYVNHFTQNITAICRRQNVLKTEMREEYEEQKTSDELYIGFEDMTLARYKQHNLIYDYGKVVGTPVSLCSIGKGVLVGTKEGTIAYYETKKSKWKAKSSNPVLKIMKYESDTSEHTIVIRQNGNIQLRDWSSGGTISKMKNHEAAIQGFIMDFRRQKYDQIICALQSGLIKAFNLIETNENITQSNKPIAQDLVVKGNIMENLQTKKAELAFEIQKMKQALNSKQQEGEAQGPILNENFALTGSLQYENGLNLKLAATNGFISGLTFEEPIMPVFIEKTEKFKYVFKEQNTTTGSVNCQVLVHSSYSTNKYQVRTLSITLPKFWKWGLSATVNNKIEGRLRFKMIERNTRYLKWARQCFFINITQKEEERLEMIAVMKLRFTNYYDKKDMELVFAQNDGFVEIHCDCLKTLGDVFQDLVNYVGCKDVNTQLHMPVEKQKIKQDLGVVERLTQTKISISTQMAQATNIIKFLLVKGESARLVGSINTLRRSFTEVMQQNRNLLAQIEKKNQNTKILAETMKSVGQFINKIASVRYGEPKAKVISRCREAIKTKNFPEIIRLMDQGVELE